MLIMVVAKLIALAVFFIWMEVLFPAVYFKQMVQHQFGTNVEGGDTSAVHLEINVAVQRVHFLAIEGVGAKAKISCATVVCFHGNSTAVPLQFHSSSLSRPPRLRPAWASGGAEGGVCVPGGTALGGGETETV